MKLISVLTIICVIAGFLLGLTYNLTADKIRYQEEKAEKDALRAVLPDASDFSKETPASYKGLNTEGRIVGYAYIAEGKGYSSTIKVVVGTDTEGNIVGIKILSQSETPGLGNRITDPNFQGQFSRKSIDDVDTITGATISSRAVIEIVRKAHEKGIS